MFSTRFAIVLLVSLNIVSVVRSEEDPVVKSKKNERMSTRLPPCAACTALVTSFEAGMAVTARGKLGGGDTAWEEKNQGSGYGQSEVGDDTTDVNDSAINVMAGLSIGLFRLGWYAEPLMG